MRHARSLDFDNLEARKLLSTAHRAVVHAAIVHHPAVHPAPARRAAAHPAPAVVLVPLTINGTLTVNNKGALASSDDMGDTTTSTPVSGVLGNLGKVTGIWNESSDSMGDYLGPDSIQLHNAQGSFTISFNNAASSGSIHKTASGSVSYQLPQKAGLGKGVFAKESETGTIDLNTNKARTVVQTMTLSTTSS